MGGTASTPVPGGGTSGYHVLRVQEGSPGHEAGLEAFFDFIISIGNTRLEEDNDTIKELLQNHKDKPVQLVVYSSKTQSCREVVLTPNSNWGGQGLMGVSIRYCSFEGANENVWHVLDVEPRSPASVAGLKPYSDFIIGADSVLSQRDDFYNLIEAADNQQIRLYVYNSDTDSCREVRLCPNSHWGGQGLLGCDIGYGYLHRIPTHRAFPTDLNPEEKTKLLNSSAVVPDTEKICKTGKAASNAVQDPSCPPPPYEKTGPPVPLPPSAAATTTVTTTTMATVSPSEATSMSSAISSVPPATTPSESSAPVFTPSSVIYPNPGGSVSTCNLPPPAPLPPNLVHLSTTAGQPFIPPPTFSAMPFSSPHAPVFPVPSIAPVPNQFIGQSRIPAPARMPSAPPQLLPATTVISLPGMPPLDVSMPALKDLHVNPPVS
ncbi:unnamed protein product [Calicophoron daubneyi]|uniref:PDZ GRASP-type domain-containing protein n=1 Tax=Calicophoron daubneyi TaxID=300641 RepID=A0AAV2TZ95_CALDB